MDHHTSHLGQEGSVQRIVWKLKQVTWCGWEQDCWSNFHQPEIGSFFKAVALAVKERKPLESVASKDIPAQKLGGERVLQEQRGKDGLGLCPLLREGARSVDNPSGGFLC